jgi:hypothetical protein
MTHQAWPSDDNRRRTYRKLFAVEAKRDRLRAALQAIAEMRVDAATDHAQLSALCIAIARAAIDKSIGGKS